MYRLVTGTYVEQYWPAVVPWLTRAVGQTCTEEDLLIIKAKAQQSVAQLWIGMKPGSEEIDFVMVTEGMILESIPTLVIRWLTSADFSQCEMDLGLLENWAYHQGYRRLQAWGRKGWERKLKPLGFTHDFTVMNKYIERGLH